MSLIASRTSDNKRPSRPAARPGIAVLLGALALAILAPGRAFAGGPATADAFWQRTAQSTTFSWQERGLREGLQRLAAAHQIQVWIDRRIDPTQRITIEITAKPLFEAVEEIAERAGAASIAVEPVLLVGPRETVLRVAASIERMRAELEATTHPSARRLRKRETVQWPMLATPHDALAAARRSWQIDAPSPDLPHDLWPAGTLREVDAAGALGLIAGGFDRGVRFSAPEVVFEPLTSLPTYTARYRAAAVPPALQNEIARRDAAALWNARGPNVDLTATAVGHAALRRALAAETHRGGASGGRVAAAESRFTLEVQQTPVAELLARLAAAGGWQLEIADGAQQAAARRISLSLRDATLSELVEAACGRAGLEGRIEEGRLRVRQTTTVTPAAESRPSR